MLTELAISTVVALAALKVGHSLGKRGDQINPPAQLSQSTQDDSIAYTWMSTNSVDGFQCPKCQWVTGRVRGKGTSNDPVLLNPDPNPWKHPELCECSEYHKAHFHFSCFVCKFKAIMRTADDK